jgi:hypothetical protein
MATTAGAGGASQLPLCILLSSVIDSFSVAHVGFNSPGGKIGDQPRSKAARDQNAAVPQSINQRSVGMMLGRGSMLAPAFALGVRRERVGAVFDADGRVLVYLIDNETAAPPGVGRYRRAVVRRYRNPHHAFSFREVLVLLAADSADLPADGCSSFGHPARRRRQRPRPDSTTSTAPAPQALPPRPRFSATR